MIIIAGHIILDFYNNIDLKLKHRHLKELCDELRKKFNLSSMEVADFDDPEKCVIGFAAVIPENWKKVSAHTLLETICKTIDQTSIARVITEDCDLLDFGK